MSLWIFQSLLNLFMVNIALLWLISRKRLKFLEAQVDRMDLELDTLKSKIRNSSDTQTKQAPQVQANHMATHALSKSEPAVFASSLVEKGPTQSLLKTNPAEAFDQASQMLSRGVSAKEISKITGLSFAELQLMNKFVARNQ